MAGVRLPLCADRERNLKSQRKEDGERIKALERLVRDKGVESQKLQERIDSITKACEATVETTRKEKENVEIGMTCARCQTLVPAACSQRQFLFVCHVDMVAFGLWWRLISRSAEAPRTPS